MKRQEKIEALRKILDGVPVEEAFPVVEVVLYESFEKEGITVALVEPRDGYKQSVIVTPNQLAASVVDDIRKWNPLKRVKAIYISRAELDAYDAWFEKEF
ncbi:hypothetical protein [Rufibacter sp. XAAS-G3-1]|uniref:hypothetical protein n=1 Tax=Rufibacter sp. XAAS-G3-1 TaxID=2729134 RepID=UPI0015E78FF1|nr:hypothetical protein [Rufibacter sp. XAAS-G3-1]